MRPGDRHIRGGLLKHDMFTRTRSLQRASLAHASLHRRATAVMNPDELRARFSGLQTWERNGQRAPNKPLLVLWAIERCLRGEDRMASYGESERALTTLLSRFAPPRNRVRPDYPFWHLRKDDVWEVLGNGPITEDSGGHAHVSSLRREDAHGGFPTDVFTALQADEALAIEIAYSLVDAHFPASLHDAVLQAVGDRIPVRTCQAPASRYGVLTGGADRLRASMCRVRVRCALERRVRCSGGRSYSIASRSGTRSGSKRACTVRAAPSIVRCRGVHLVAGSESRGGVVGERRRFRWLARTLSFASSVSSGK